MCAAIIYREHGPRAYAEDVELSEDAAFVATLPWLRENGDEVTYIGKRGRVHIPVTQGIKRFSGSFIRIVT